MIFNLLGVARASLHHCDDNRRICDVTIGVRRRKRCYVIGYETAGNVDLLQRRKATHEVVLAVVVNRLGTPLRYRFC